MSTATLTSLAMLKVNIDEGGDYLNYLIPFVLQILVVHHPDSFTDQFVREHILKDYGLEIPNRTIQIVLGRILKKHPLKKMDRMYHIIDDLKAPEITTKKRMAIRYIQDVVSELIEFSKSTPKPIRDENYAVSALCAFLAKFDIPCLRAYLRGTTIPDIDDQSDFDIALISQYVIYLQKRKPDLFKSFLVMVQGHMFANALLCPDLQHAPREYKGLTFYFDTPLLIQRLGLEGKQNKESVETLIRLLDNLGAVVAAFSHSVEEIKNVIKGAAHHIDDQNARAALITEARRNNITKSDLLLRAENIDGELKKLNIVIRDTPKYSTDFQIDELDFEQVIEEEMSYLNPKAKEYDINSVRSIYVLRGKRSPQSIEKSAAVLVTSNSKLADAAWKYGQKHSASYEVSSVIPSFSLANIAWLKAPMGAPNLPTHEILAFSYAALQPSKRLLSKYLTEIDKLEQQSKISVRDHQLLRSNMLAQDELMKLTLGDEDELTQETLIEMAKRVSDEIKEEGNAQLIAEKKAHCQTQKQRDSQGQMIERAKEHLYWRCDRKAKIFSWITSTLITGLLLVGCLAVNFGWEPNNQKIYWVTIYWVIRVSSGMFLLLTVGNFVFGTTVKSFHQRMQDSYRRWFVKRESAIDELSPKNDRIDR